MYTKTYKLIVEFLNCFISADSKVTEEIISRDNIFIYLFIYQFIYFIVVPTTVRQPIIVDTTIYNTILYNKSINNNDDNNNNNNNNNNNISYIAFLEFWRSPSHSSRSSTRFFFLTWVKLMKFQCCSYFSR